MTGGVRARWRLEDEMRRAIRGRNSEIGEEKGKYGERGEEETAEGGGGEGMASCLREGSPAFPQCQPAGSTPSGSILKHRPTLHTPARTT